ncbi:MAG TPA: alpha/beta hydrolase [Acidimicrobiia bacterium]|nr:alpha/beta hydrolase [Acidimicrobiia bacterium]
MRVETVHVDVSEAVDLPGPQHTAATVFAPDPLPDELVVALGFPGGGYNRLYFDLPVELPGPGGSSEARWHAERGWCFVACDHLGVGDSSRPEPASLTIESLAAANDATVRAVTTSLGPARVRARLGFGQSMGGCLTIVTQARHRTFDGIGILGYSAIHTVLPTPPGRSTSQPEVARGAAADIRETTEMIGRETFRYAFFWEDVPAELVEHDLADYPLRSGAEAPPWASPPPPCAVPMLSPGVVAGEAAQIDVPVLVGAGERDTVPDPDREPGAYPKADVTVFVAPRMAHMHDFASTRELLWARIHSWGDAVAATR